MGHNANNPVSYGKKAEGVLAKLLKVLLPLAVSAAFVLWILHNVDFRNVMKILRSGVDYRYILVMCALVILSFIIRGIRWGMQLRAAGIPRMPWLAESVSIFGAYALNIIFPYLGEAWRCVYVSRRENCKLSTVVGTDIGDRISDAIVIGLLILLTLWVATPALKHFADHFAVGETLSKIVTDKTTWIIVGVTLITAVACFFLLRHKPFVKGAATSLIRIWHGFAVLFHMHGIGLYLVYTAGIWVCYFLETYFCFFAFDFTRELINSPGMVYGLVPGLVVFVFGSISIAVPSNGGLGPWNMAVMFALMLYGINSDDAAAYSLVCWSFMAVTQMLSGVFSMFYIHWDKRHDSSSGASQRS